MKCRLCRTTFTLAAQHANFPRGTGATRTIADAELGTATSPMLLLAVALSGAIGLAFAFLVASSRDWLVHPLFAWPDHRRGPIAGDGHHSGHHQSHYSNSWGEEFSPFWVRNHEISECGVGQRAKPQLSASAKRQLSFVRSSSCARLTTRGCMC
jgi:hypothetical protein